MGKLDSQFVQPHLDVALQIRQRHLFFAAVAVVLEQEAAGLHARRVVLHVDGDGAARLGVAVQVGI